MGCTEEEIKFRKFENDSNLFKQEYIVTKKKYLSDVPNDKREDSILYENKRNNFYII